MEKIVKKQYETCNVCGCKSRVYQIVQCAVHRGAHLVCPGEEKHPGLHDKLAGKLNELEGYHPRSYIEELIQEIQLLKKRFLDVSPKEK